MNLVSKVFLFLIFLPTIVCANDKFITKTAVVDVESILEHSTAIVSIKKSINTISENIQTELFEKQKALKAAEEDILKQKESLDEEVFNGLIADFNKKVSAIQQEMHQKKSALEQAHASALAEVHKNTIIVISELSKKYGFNLVLPSTQVLFVENDLNITLEVISSLNDRLKTVDVKYDITNK